MNYYNFNKLISKLETDKKNKFVEIQSKPDPNYSQIYIIITQSGMNKVYLKFIPQKASFNIEIVKIFLGDVFVFRSDKNYNDSDIDFILENIYKIISNLMINESISLYSGEGNIDYLEMLNEHIRIIELELSRK